MSAKTTYQRSAKGPVSIMECAADGKYVAVENTGRKVRTQPQPTVQSHAADYVTWRFRPRVTNSAHLKRPET